MNDTGTLDVDQLNINTEVQTPAAAPGPAPASKEAQDCGCITLKDVSYEMTRALYDTKRW